jgi:hypothetical protein
MNSKRLYFSLIGSLVLLFIALIVGTLQVNKYLSKQANDLTALKAKSMALSQEQTSLAKAKKDIKQYSDLNNVTRTIVPEDKSQAEAVREIVNVADANKVTLGTVSFPSSTLGAAAGKTSTVATSTPVISNPATDKLSQLKPVLGIVGVYQLSINVDSDTNSPVTYDQFIGFLSGLEHNRRTAQVNTITIEPKKGNTSLLDFKLTLNEYIKP